jgi:hypothetical protein
MLLSLVGEVNMMAHLGVKIAIGIIGEPPPISRIVRKQRHHKFSVKHLGTYPTSQFSKPNHHELLTDLRFVINRETTQGTFSRFSLADGFTEDCLVKIQSPEVPVKAAKAKSSRKPKA